MQQLEQHSSKIRLALYGQSQSSLTYSALRIAQGLCGSWNIAVIDTTGCAARYAHLGMFTTIHLSAPYDPRRYYDAMEICAGMEVIILNTITPEYNGQGGVLDLLNGGDYENAMRAHRAFLTGIRESDAHVICTATTKARLTMKGGGRLSISQMPVQQDRLENYFDTVLQLDRSNRAHVVKDDTGLLPLKHPFPIGVEIGAQLQRWCNHIQTVPDCLQWKINNCNTIQELYQLLFQTDTDDPGVIASFTKRRLQLEGSREAVEELIDVPF